MLKSITIKNGFRHHDVTYTFQPGLTTITGANETGKSLILEFARFALFGSKALRGKADDYKKLYVALEFSINGKDYKVERKNGNAVLYSVSFDAGAPAWAPMAVGTSTVNVKVPELFGYGLDVFDAAHAVNQGQVEALGNMKPAERKRMVDSVIGLTVLDDLIKFAGDTAALHEREAEAIDGVLVEPKQPEKPETYEKSSQVLKNDVTKLTALKSEKDQIDGWLQNEMAEPQAPAACPIAETAEELKQHQAACKFMNDRQQELERKKANLRLPQYSAIALNEIEADIEAHEKYAHYQLRLRAMPPKSALTLDNIKKFGEYIDYYGAWARKMALWEKHRIECPECHHEFASGVEKPTEEHLAEPEWTSVQLAEQEGWIHAWETPPPSAPKPDTDEPKLTRQWLKAERSLLGHADILRDIENELAALVIPPDRSADLQVRLDYEVRLQVYKASKANYDVWVLQKLGKSQRLSELLYAPAELAQVQVLYQAALMYENDLKSYTSAKRAYDANMKKRDEARTQATEYKKARSALQLLKSKVKSHLVPSLNKVASLLLQQMTNGARQTIEVNEDFEILVDGQELGTLSGSAKAVANLAVRIGLGQVLTNRVFSVFMGDEIDAAMDIDRAGSTAACLRGLSTRIKQLILVTHKRPDADHYIELGEAA